MEHTARGNVETETIVVFKRQIRFILLDIIFGIDNVSRRTCSCAVLFIFLTVDPTFHGTHFFLYFHPFCSLFTPIFATFFVYCAIFNSFW